VDKIEVLIVGGGISGLHVALNLRNIAFTLLESEETLGGYCRTIRKNGFIWDYSGHFYHFKDSDIRQHFIDSVGSDNIIYQKKIAKVFIDNGYIDAPIQYNLRQLSPELLSQCIHDLYFSAPTNSTNSFIDHITSAYGKALCEVFLIPYNEKLYSTSLDNLDKNAMGRFFPSVDKDQIFSTLNAGSSPSEYNSSFLYPSKGSDTYINGITQDIDKSQLSTQETLLQIDINRKVAITSRREICFRRLVTTIPLNRLYSIIERQLPSCLQHASIFSYSKVLVLNLGFDLPNNNKFHWAYYPDKDICFYRIGCYDQILNQNRMSLYVEISIPGDDTRNLTQLVDFFIPKVDADLRKTGILQDHQLTDFHPLLLDPAYVHISTESISFVDELRQHLESEGISTLGRYGRWTYCSIEDNIIEAKRLAAKIMKSY